MMVVMLMVVVVLIVVMVVVMLVVVVILIVVVMVVMLVVVVILIVVMVVVMLMVVVILIMVVMVVAAAIRIIALLVLKMLMQKLLQLGRDGVFLLDGIQDLAAGELAPIGGDDDGLGIFLPQQSLCLGDLFLGHVPCAGQNNAVGGLNLVIEEFAEILHIELGTGGVHHGGQAAQSEFLGACGLHGGHDLGELAHAGRLNDDAIRMVLLGHHVKGLAEVTGEAAADAAGVHLVDGDTGILQKAAVDADLAEFIFDEHQLLAHISLSNEFLDEGRLTGSQKAGDNVNFCHGISPF
jgi:hypothetical protein